MTVIFVQTHVKYKCLYLILNQLYVFASDFILRIESLIVPENTILVTYDVTIMYTNMEFDEFGVLTKASDEQLTKK